MRKDPKTQVCSNPDCPKEQPRPIEEFAIRTDSGKRRGQCKDCVAARRSKHWFNNKERLSAWQKAHYEANKEAILARNKEYWFANLEERTKWKREYYQSEAGKKARNDRRRARKKEDPSYKLRLSVSNSIRTAILGNGGKKKGSTWKHLPYTPQELRDHIESLFAPWMTWENYGVYDPETHATNPTWQVDHIIPHSTFKYKSMRSKAFRKCWALSNLRPLDSKINNKDGATRVRHNKKR